MNSESPIVFYFHGWQDDASACGDFCTDAKSQGFITVSMLGMGGSSVGNSWNGAGSTESPGTDGVTCNPNPYGYDSGDNVCYTDCGTCDDLCWWTTCEDSVGQVFDVLEYMFENFCIDLDMVWATGCSNGGIFLHELAKDNRVAPYLAGIAPQVGLPHPGFNIAPESAMNYMGIWGLKDRTVPPVANYQTDYVYDPDVASERNGWLYTTSDVVTELWSDTLGCTEDSSQDISQGEEKIDSCWVYDDCTVTGAVVAGCHFRGGHVCNESYQNNILLDFMLAHPKPSGSL